MSNGRKPRRLSKSQRETGEMMDTTAVKGFLGFANAKEARAFGAKWARLSHEDRLLLPLIDPKHIDPPVDATATPTAEERVQAARDRAQKAYNAIAAKAGAQPQLPLQWETAAVTKLLLDAGVFTMADLVEVVADNAEETASAVMRQVLTQQVASDIAGGKPRLVH